MIRFTDLSIARAGKLLFSGASLIIHPGERIALVGQLKELGANERGELTGEMEFDDAFADAGAATGELNETLSIISNLKTELDDIDAALAKLDAGTYGTCVDCGKQIDAARLEFRPNSIRCVTCKDAAS